MFTNLDSDGSKTKNETTHARAAYRIQSTADIATITMTTGIKLK